MITSDSFGKNKKLLKIAIAPAGYGSTEMDGRLHKLFKEMLDKIKKAHPNNFTYDDVEVSTFSYGEDTKLLSANSIATLSPIKYITAKQKLEGKIIPLFAVKKKFNRKPYYPAYFIANKNSNIDSIYSPIIKKLFIVSKKSASGYVVPIYKLWQAGVIEEPSSNAVEKRGWKITSYGKHQEVIARIQDADNLDAIGVVCDNWYTEKEIPIKILLLHYYIPQDVLVISSDLIPYKATIENWFISLFKTNDNGEYLDNNAKILINSSNKISGFVKFNEELANAYQELRQMYNKVDNPKEIDNLKIPYNKTKFDNENGIVDITIMDLIKLLGQLRVSTFWTFVGSIIGALLSIAGAAYWFGIKSRK